MAMRLTVTMRVLNAARGNRSVADHPPAGSHDIERERTLRSPYFAALLACVSLTSGCTAGGWYPGRIETFSSLGSTPPAEQTETLNRIAHRWQPPLPPVFVESGNVWPGPPPVVLTLVDLRREHLPDVARPRMHRGGFGMCSGPAGPGLALGIC